MTVEGVRGPSSGNVETRIDGFESATDAGLVKLVGNELALARLALSLGVGLGRSISELAASRKRASPDGLVGIGDGRLLPFGAVAASGARGEPVRKGSVCDIMPLLSTVSAAMRGEEKVK